MTKTLIGTAIALALSMPAAAFADLKQEVEAECRELAKEEEVSAEDMKSFVEDCVAEIMESAEAEQEPKDKPGSE